MGCWMHAWMDGKKKGWMYTDDTHHSLVSLSDLPPGRSKCPRGRPWSTSRYFWPILTPHFPVTRLTFRDPPESTSHISDPLPRFLVGLVQKTRTKAPCTNSLSIVCGVFVRGFCPGWFLSIPPSVRIHLLQQKDKYHLNTFAAKKIGWFPHAICQCKKFKRNFFKIKF